MVYDYTFWLLTSQIRLLNFNIKYYFQIANVERDAKGPIANAILLARAKLVRAIKMVII